MSKVGGNLVKGQPRKKWTEVIKNLERRYINTNFLRSHS